MGFIPLFLTASGACLLFFLTVRHYMLGKITFQRNLASQLAQAHPELGIVAVELINPEKIQKLLKDESAQKAIPQSSIELLRAMKVNQYQYNRLIKKAPYNWVAAFGGFKEI
jgi:hypothetical protein